MGPSVKHVLGVLELFYMLTEKILFHNRGLPFFYHGPWECIRHCKKGPSILLSRGATSGETAIKLYSLQPRSLPPDQSWLNMFSKDSHGRISESKIYFVCLLNQSSTWNDNLNICVNLNNFEFLCIYLFNCYLLVFYLKDGGLDSAAREHSLPTSGARPSYRLPPPSLIKRFST